MMCDLLEGWVETTLGEVINIYSGKTRPKQRGAYPVYGGNGILDYGDKFNQEGEIIIVGRVGAYCGNVFYETQPFWLSDNALGMKAKEISCEKFLYYKLVSMSLNNHAIGGAQPLLTQTLLKELEINLPPLPEQKAIADMLSSFDEKIELLREQNKTLETLAQTIFKEWFVKFKAPWPPEGGENNTASKGDGGKSPSGDLGAMVDSELGLIPKGWRVGKISDLGKIVCGKTPSKAKKEYFDGDVPFIKIPDMHNKMFIVETTDTLSQEGKASQALKTIPKDSVSVSCIATVGLVSISIKESQTNQQINTIIPKEENLREFIFLDMQKRKKYLMDIGSGGTATLNVNTRTFSNIEVMIPSEHVLADFSATVSPTFDKILENCLQIQTLSQTRDTLLPKLMSGKLRAES